MTNARISFSQYQLFKNCKHRWKLKYIDKHVLSEPGIALIFGTAMHEVFQLYIQTLYEKTVVAANELDLETMLQETLYGLYAKELATNENKHFSSAVELTEYFRDGVEIIRWFKSNRDKFFIKKDWELIGIELPLSIQPVSTHPSITLVGYLDLVMRHIPTGKIVIYDFKTSTRGWGKYAKGDKTKISQLVLYKTYYAKQFNVDPDVISVEYLILKRKIDYDAEYAVIRNRMQKFEPAHGKRSQNLISSEITQFITNHFNTDGTHNVDAEMPATAGENEYNCKFCEFKNRHDLCPPEKRIVGND